MNHGDRLYDVILRRCYNVDKILMADMNSYIKQTTAQDNEKTKQRAAMNVILQKTQNQQI